MRLHRLFKIDTKRIDSEESLIVVVADGAERCCLMVDTVQDQQQVVIKSLGSFFGALPGVSGGAVMGDGKISLLLDVPGLIHLACQHDKPLP